ncbi:EpsG family protein [Cupriavidus malaysiensis]|uniref:EpsG family protein n=1 Tax=Cupriavidus malaysiensis TaxID=367825 RepID=UPI0009FF8DC0|nr:EpsG family protein [Cupriavidus malaysiensis]
MKTRTLKTIFWAVSIATLLRVLSGYQAFGESRDYDNYLQFFDAVRVSANFNDISYRFEPGFSAVVYALVKIGLNNPVVYAVIAGVAVFVKCCAVPHSRRYVFVFAVFVFYLLTRYLALFEMTVLRANCAFALAFLVFVRRETPEYRVKDLVLLLGGVLFHYSAIVFLFIYSIKRVTRLRVVLIAVVAFLAIMVSKGVLLSYLQGYLNALSNYSDAGKTATTFPVLFMLDLLLLIFILLTWQACDLPMRYCALGIALSASFHFALLDNSVFAGRFRELLSVFVLIYVLRAFSCRSPLVKSISSMFVLATGVLHVYVTYFYDPLLT